MADLTFAQAVAHIQDMRNTYAAFEKLGEVLGKAAQAEGVIAESAGKLAAIKAEIAEAGETFNIAVKAAVRQKNAAAKEHDAALVKYAQEEEAARQRNWNLSVENEALSKQRDGLKLALGSLQAAALAATQQGG